MDLNRSSSRKSFYGRLGRCARALRAISRQGCSCKLQRFGARGRNRTGTVFPPRDFKSLASTNFATRAIRNGLYYYATFGGWGRNRTGVHGVAVRCITTLPPSHFFYILKAAELSQNSTVSALIHRGIIKIKLKNWSGKRDSNSRPRPWQGRALPTELFPLCFNQLWQLKLLSQSCNILLHKPLSQKRRYFNVKANRVKGRSFFF